MNITHNGRTYFVQNEQAIWELYLQLTPKAA